MTEQERELIETIKNLRLMADRKESNKEGLMLLAKELEEFLAASHIPKDSDESQADSQSGGT